MSLAALRTEAEYYGILPLVQKLDLVAGKSACGGLLFHARLKPSRSEGPVVQVAGAHHLLAVAHRHFVTCWRCRTPQKKRKEKKKRRKKRIK